MPSVFQPFPTMRLPLLLTLGALVLAGCEQLGLEDPAKAAAAKEAEGRAVGSGCRHSGRSLEDCYSKNPKQSKAAIFTGWRDMDAYMRENNIEVVPASGTRKKSANESPAGGDVPAKKDSSSSEAPALPKGNGKQA